MKIFGGLSAAVMTGGLALATLGKTLGMFGASLSMGWTAWIVAINPEIDLMSISKHMILNQVIALL
jgi:hypothetical protein